MKFLVTGATGFVGSQLAAELVHRYAAKRHDFVFMGHSTPLPNHQNNRKTQITWVQGDVALAHSIEPFITDCNVIFHAAAHVSYGDFDDAPYYRVNVDGTESIDLPRSREVLAGADGEEI